MFVCYEKAYIETSYNKYQKNKIKESVNLYVSMIQSKNDTYILLDLII